MLYILTLWIRGFHICLSFWWLLCHKYASQDQSGPRGEGDRNQDVYFARRRAAFAETACCRFWLLSNFTCGGGAATPELLCSKICFCIWIHMAFEHYNSIPGQWLNTCRAGRPPGGKVITGEEPRGAEASGERHAPQRVATLSFELYSFFVF